MPEKLTRRNRRGVSLLEVLAASIAGTVTLAAAASLYVMALQVYITSSRGSESLVFEGLVEERIARVLATAGSDENMDSPPLSATRFTLFPRNQVTRNGTATQRGNRWVAVAYDYNEDHDDRTSRFPRVVVAGANVRRVTGLIYWWRDQDPNHRESRIYQLEVRQDRQAAYAGFLPGFTPAGGLAGFRSLGEGQIQTLIDTPAIRAASRILAQEVRDFDLVEVEGNPPTTAPNLDGDTPEFQYTVLYTIAPR